MSESTSATPAENLVHLLPHRPPMRFLERAWMDGEALLLARQTIPPADDPIFLGHFPGHPMWPGVLLLEAMAQTTAVFMLHHRGGASPDAFPVLGAADTRFLKPVGPGDVLLYETRMVRELGDDALFSVTARFAIIDPGSDRVEVSSDLAARTRVTVAIRSPQET
ncbi:MAG: hypothetical protein AAGN46_03055 [Acidobacteriota bacterium]